MLTRRPRVKAAAILKPRRPLTANESNADKSIHVKQEIGDDETAPDTSNVSIKKCHERNANGQDGEQSQAPSSPKPIENQQESKVSVHKMEEDSYASDTVENKPPPSPSAIDTKALKTIPKLPMVTTANAKPSPSFRRISAPPVNIINRRRSIVENRSGNCSSPKYIRSPSYSFASQVRPDASKSNVATHHSGKDGGGGGNSVKSPGAATASTSCDEEVFSPAAAGAAAATTTTTTTTENDECFKSPPFMSPIYTPRRIESNMSPFHDIYGEDCTRSPSQMPNNSSGVSGNNAKLRQRIRPTPCFASRRNSIQGSSSSGAIGTGCESEDEQFRRQRHYSTSSNHSTYNPASTPQHQRNYFGLNKIPTRVRTESYSSSISDLPFSKTKRSHRSEEYQRVANAKREFNQRLNGKPPDKTRLTMYDLIYYNPLTNPMSKPAGKGGSGGDGKNGDAASLASVKTNQSRESMKSEANSVKSERLDSNVVANATAATATAATAAAAVTAAAAAKAATANGPVPQLKLDVNGEIILDEKSLVIETTANKEARQVLASSDVVYDDEFSGTSGFYKRQKRTRDWLPLETLKFYRSLQTIGTDFSVMLQLFPNRSRRDLKLKFKKEEKHNMALINKALMHPKEFNVDELKLQFDKEDEEIEQKKQEWAEVKKRMASERREQLNASKRRNPNKQISRSMRSLTDGDILYENEFVSLPPKTKRTRKRNVVDVDANGLLKQLPDDSVFSPTSINHNNNHVDIFPQHTYATHKLPNFLEMIATQHKNAHEISTHTDQNSIHSPSHSPLANHVAPIKYTMHKNCKFTNIESNGDTYGIDNYDDDDSQSMHAIDLSISAAVTTTNSTTASPSPAAAATPPPSIIIHCAQDSPTEVTVEQPNNGNNVVECANESIEIGQYIAKNPNLTFKGTGDIMNMDIIFENVSIEEDTSVEQTITTENILSASSQPTTTTTTTATTATTTTTNVVDGQHLPGDVLPDDGDRETKQQVEHVNINGVHYQIITIENELITDEAIDIAEDSTAIATEFIDDNNDENCMIDTNVVVMSNLDVAAEVETHGEMLTAEDDRSLTMADESTIAVTATAISSVSVNSESKDTKFAFSADDANNDDNDELHVQQHLRAHGQHTENSVPIERRKRKQKIVPLLAMNKRTRRNHTNRTVDREGQSELMQPHRQLNQSKEEEEAEQEQRIMQSKYECEPDVVSYPIEIKPSVNIASTTAETYEFQSEQTQNTVGYGDDAEDDTHSDIDTESYVKEEKQPDNDDQAPEHSFLDSLVVVESQDPNDPNRTIHEVFVVDPDTKEMSEKPLDLPEHVIQRIRLAIS